MCIEAKRRKTRRNKLNCCSPPPQGMCGRHLKRTSWEKLEKEKNATFVRIIYILHVCVPGTNFSDTTIILIY